MAIEPFDEMIDKELERLCAAVHEKLGRHGAGAIYQFTDEERLYYEDVIRPTECEHGGRRQTCRACRVAMEKTSRA